MLVKTGGGLATVNCAVPLTTPLDAVTVNGPPAAAAVNNPHPLMVPPPLTVHETVAAIAFPYWSRGAAVNCCVAPVRVVALAGLTVIVVNTGGGLLIVNDSAWLTVAFAASVTVTVKFAAPTAA